jgi:hypothetical protein
MNLRVRVVIWLVVIIPVNGQRPMARRAAAGSSGSVHAACLPLPTPSSDRLFHKRLEMMPTRRGSTVDTRTAPRIRPEPQASGVLPVTRARPVA